ncbi:UNVERIFIED_CONTAM: hypothetical protein GTU68_052809, partial [Idotea baltica]|nr:hypothetical protein [Idotea baltica]
YPKSKIKILLLERIHDEARRILSDSGYDVETIDRALTDEELLAKLADVHVLGVRSKTQVNKAHLEVGKKLLGVGCFSVGTNNVDLSAARELGIPVLNAPYGNTRSVAELTISNILSLSRQIAHKSLLMHQGVWQKSAEGSFEVRDKTLGIIGYGNIGQQVSVLAEAFGMHVVFHDSVKKLPLGNSKQLNSLEEVLQRSDFVTLHIPPLAKTKALLGAKEISQMKQGSFLLNAARGSLVDIPALCEALKANHIAGAAVDVFPDEPKSNDDPFISPLIDCENVILTPHVGGSTEEAQLNIGLEVSSAFVKLIDNGSTVGAVNFPQLDLPVDADSHRILNIHRNEPGVLSDVNRIISELGANVNGQYLGTYENVGYLIVDIGVDVSDAVKRALSALPSNIKTRILY